jgi:GNAT superfamily N-acetyltransferase
MRFDVNIEFNSNIESVDWIRISEIFSLVGWGIRHPEEIKSAFKQSSFVRFAYSNGVLVGFGRTVDDGRYYALIVDLVVHPEFQRMGIGTTVLLYLKNCLENYSFTTLTSAVGKEVFYERQGWKKQVTSFIWPRSEKQRKENT